MNRNNREGTSPHEIEVSPATMATINFVLNYQPYRCYDAAPRIKALLLKEGLEGEILTIPSGSHYWVKLGTQIFSTADMSNFRQSPIKNKKTEEMEDAAIMHAKNDTDSTFRDWILDKNKEYQQLQDRLETEIKNI